VTVPVIYLGKGMFVRSAGGRVLRSCTQATRTQFTRASDKRVLARRFSSASSSASPGHGPAPTAHPLACVASQLDHVAPRFEIDPDNIQILDGPTLFYETLKVLPPDLSAQDGRVLRSCCRPR
jgi:hypothetical protein